MEVILNDVIVNSMKHIKTCSDDELRRIVSATLMLLVAYRVMPLEDLDALIKVDQKEKDQ